MEMTPDFLKKLCKENNLYITPSVNDRLYLQYKGFTKIQSLEEYISLKTLYLEGNGLKVIEGLSTNTMLTSLFLQENAIETIENLDNQINLQTLNVARNAIHTIENLSHMHKLVTLNLANNFLSSVDDIQHLLQVPSIVTLDIQNNKIDDEQVIDLVLSKLPNLRVLYLQGNPIVNKIPHYRKSMLSRCKQLLYLDDRPVYEEERRRVDVWSQAYEINHDYKEARDAEQELIGLIKQESLSLDAKNVALFAKIVREGQMNRTIPDTKLSSEDSPLRACSETFTSTTSTASSIISISTSLGVNTQGQKGSGKSLQLLDDTQNLSKIRQEDESIDADMLMSID